VDLNRLQVTSLSTDNFTLGIGMECNKKIGWVRSPFPSLVCKRF
jgi:hypothetical protein